MSITNLSIFRSSETISALRQLLALAEKGGITGLVACGICADGERRVVMTGRCAAEPGVALSAAMKMSWKATRRQDELDGTHPLRRA